MPQAMNGNAPSSPDLGRPELASADVPLPASRRPRRPLWPLALWMVASLGVVTATKVLTYDYLGEATPFLLYFAAIIGAGWYGGWAGGLLATVLSAMLGAYFFMPRLHAADPLDLHTVTRVGAFLLEGTVMTWIMTHLQSVGDRARASVDAAQSASAKLDGVLRGVVDGITVQNAKGELIYANSAAAKLIGFPSAELLLAAPVSDIIAKFELFTPEGQPFPMAELPGRLALSGLPTPERLMRFRLRATGEERWALVRANRIILPGADLPYAVNVFQDVTEQRRRDEDLRISRERYLTTLSSIGDAVIATDAQGRVTFVNAVAERLTGWDAASAENQPLSEVFRIFNEETRAPIETPVDLVLREGVVVGLANHTVLISRTGAEFCIDDSAAPIRAADGKTVGTVLVFRDVTGQRAQEQRRTFIARAVAELASSLDYRQTLATVARSAVPIIADWCAVDMYEAGTLRRLAVAHVDPDKVRLVYEIEQRYPPDPERPSGSLRVARSGEALFVAEISDEMLAAAARDAEHLRLIQQLQLRSYIAVPLHSKGAVTGVLTLAMAESGRVYSDDDRQLALSLADRAGLAIEQARLYAEATEARNQAERANRTKDEFLAMLGHELRNPLAPMLTALQLMKLRAPRAVERERAVLERQVKHVATLVDDLLDISRITRNGIQLAKEKVDLADMVARALEMAGPLIEGRRHTVVVSVERGSFVAGDSIRLAQVLTNLVTNSAKYTDPGGIIEVLGERSGDELTIRVKDNGVGIQPEILPHVFDLFVQGGQSLDRAMGGLGLGLTIVRTVVELHGGRVYAESGGPGMGSEFRVVLPALPPGVVPESQPASPITPAPDPNHPVLDVLVVDDNHDALELLAEGLQMFGYRTHMASDAAVALAVAESVKPAIALLDIGLPVMDGYELARRLRAIPELSKIKLVAITGYGQASDRERTRSAGFDRHLVKPIDLDQVQGLLTELLSSPGE